jgi:heme A synthase
MVLLGALPGRPGFVVDVHALLGLIFLAVAHYSRARLRREAVPSSLLRVANWAAILATVQVLLGLALYAAFRFGIDIGSATYLAISVVHLIVALGILAESAGLFTGYGVWRAQTSPSSP